MPTYDAQLFLAGHYVDGATDDVVTIHSPVTGEHLADLPVPSGDQVDQAVQAARTAFEQYRHWSTQERADLCHRVADLIEENADELAHLTTIEQGKPLHAEAHGDVEDTASLFRVSAEDSLRLYGETIPSGERNKRLFTWRAPIGVWAAVTPWNFPLMIATEFIAPALATGNAVVAKPPAITPLAALKLGQLLSEAGVPEGLVSILPGSINTPFFNNARSKIGVQPMPIPPASYTARLLLTRAVTPRSHSTILPATLAGSSTGVPPLSMAA